MSNNDRYVIILKNERTQTYIRLAYVLALINIVPFILFVFSRPSMTYGIVGLGITILYFLIKYFKVKRKVDPSYIDEFFFFLLAAVWLLESITMAILILLTGLLFKITLQKFRFIFSRDYILKEFFPGKKIAWDEMQTVVLKAGILTLDFKNNRLLQSPIENAGEVDEDDFNTFASEMLSA